MTGGMTQSVEPFTVILTRPLVKAVSIVLASQLPNFSYHIGSAAMIIQLPALTVTPTDADLDLSFELVSGQEISTLVPAAAGLQAVRIHTFDLSMTSMHTITVKMTDNITMIQNVFSF